MGWYDDVMMMRHQIIVLSFGVGRTAWTFWITLLHVRKKDAITLVHANLLVNYFKTCIFYPINIQLFIFYLNVILTTYSTYMIVKSKYMYICLNMYRHNIFISNRNWKVVKNEQLFHPLIILRYFFDVWRINHAIQSTFTCTLSCINLVWSCEGHMNNPYSTTP